uniref:RING-type domain-containing protein n=1 Tax=Panagrolaimus davidi TaxID=227884 RepID=A0A914P3L4_9BILA
MGNFLSTCKRVIVEPVFEAVTSIFKSVIEFFTSVEKAICDAIFRVLQFEYSSQQNQAEIQERIAEQRRKKASCRQMMACKCCKNNNFVDYIFDCAHMVCGSCNRSTCANRCFECNEIIRHRIEMDYPRHELN